MAPLFTADKFNFFGYSAPTPKPNVTATGGTISTPGDGYRYHVITSSGSFAIADNPGNYVFEAILFGGGGGGGNGGDAYGGAGGSGGGVWIGGPGNLTLPTATHPITIGNGGTANQNGGDTTLSWPSTIIAEGGGFGGSRWQTPTQASSGGSGGGAGYSGGANNGTQPTQSNPAPGAYSVSKIGGNGHPSHPGYGGSANPTNDRDMNWNVGVLEESPLGNPMPTKGAMGRGGETTRDGGPAQDHWTPTMPGGAYGTGAPGAGGGGGTGGAGVVVVRYEYFPNA